MLIIKNILSWHNIFKQLIYNFDVKACYFYQMCATNMSLEKLRLVNKAETNKNKIIM